MKKTTLSKTIRLAFAVGIIGILSQHAEAQTLGRYSASTNFKVDQFSPQFDQPIIASLSNVTIPTAKKLTLQPPAFKTAQKSKRAKRKVRPNKSPSKSTNLTKVEKANEPELADDNRSSNEAGKLLSGFSNIAAAPIAVTHGSRFELSSANAVSFASLH